MRPEEQQVQYKSPRPGAALPAGGPLGEAVWELTAGRVAYFYLPTVLSHFFFFLIRRFYRLVWTSEFLESWTVWGSGIAGLSFPPFPAAEPASPRPALLHAHKHVGCQVSKGEGSGQRPGHSPRPSPLVPSSCPCILSGKCTRVPSFQSPTRAQGARAFWQGSQVRSLLSGHGGWARGCPSRENLCAAPVARHLRPGAAPGRALCQAGPGWRDAAPRAPRGQDLESQADQVLCRRGRNSAVHSAQRGARRHIRAKARLSRTYSAAREALRGLRLRRTNPAPPRNSPSLELRWV